MTTATASELLIGWIVSNVSQTVGTGYTFEEQPEFNFFGYSEDKTSGSPGSDVADSTGASTSWIDWIVAFKAPAAGGTSSHSTLLGVG